MNSVERAYANDRITVIWARQFTDNPKEFRLDPAIVIPRPMERYHEVWDVIGSALKLMGIE